MQHPDKHVKTNITHRKKQENGVDNLFRTCNSSIIWKALKLIAQLLLSRLKFS
jgi:hypothetical protein